MWGHVRARRGDVRARRRSVAQERRCGRGSGRRCSTGVVVTDDGHVEQRRRARRGGWSGGESGTVGKKAAPRVGQHRARWRDSTRPTEATPGSTWIRREAPPFEAVRGGSGGDGAGAGASSGHWRWILPSRGAKDKQLILTTIAYASPDHARPLEAADHCSVHDRLVQVTGLHCSCFLSPYGIFVAPDGAAVSLTGLLVIFDF
jgi:hypothetical protein